MDQARQFLFERMVHRESIIFNVRDLNMKRMVGFTQLYPVFSSISMKRSLILNDLYVLEEHRKTGVGQLLLDEARKYAQLKGLELSTAADNERAQRLYERSGYVKDEQFIHYFLNVNDDRTSGD
ncbi:GNAT family N-acetyltransferase [Paenibacillus beijingensis]|uniref:GNAT family N-acetyltransferase n=1 Tax=Paenibacillus beijingensis TaxID=1126833 RepID=UPI001EE76D4F|nr:N-acetyltransferase [Paenibacillus beijingensis]